jgi:hypothetical protein
MNSRRFPPPWSVEEQPACFVVHDHNGQALAYVYFENGPGRRSGGKIIGAGRGETDRGKYRKTAGAIKPPSDVGNAMMSNLLLQILIVVAFGAFCFGCGYLTAFILTRNRWRDEMIKRGVARYNGQTGVWEWEPPTKPH